MQQFVSFYFITGKKNSVIDYICRSLVFGYRCLRSTAGHQVNTYVEVGCSILHKDGKSVDELVNFY